MQQGGFKIVAEVVKTFGELCDRSKLPASSATAKRNVATALALINEVVGMSTADDLERTKVRFSMALLPVRQRAILVGLLSALAIALLVIMGMLFFGMWLDLTIPLPVGFRRLILLLTAAAAIASIVLLVLHARRVASEHELARKVDEAAGADGEVMSGFDLLNHGIPSENNTGKQHRAADDNLSVSLAALAADQAQQFCEQVDPAEVISTQSAKVWWRNAGIAALVILLIGVMVPRMAWTQAQRILIPMESQLPYSPTALLVEPGDTEVLFGNDLEISATIEGPLVEDLELVLKFDDESQETLPLLAETDERWKTYLTRVTRPADYYVRAEGTRSSTHRLDVRMTPAIKSVRCAVTPPPYTRRAKYEGPIPESGFQGLAGTKVEISMKSNRPLSRGTLEIDDGENQKTITLNPKASAGDSDETLPSQTVEGSFVIEKNGRFRLSLTDIDEIPSLETIEGNITVIADQKPVIKLLQPKPISLATPNIPLPIVIAAEDDYGLTRLELFRGLNQSPEMPTPLELKSNDASVRIKTSLPLSAYGLEPGDEITLFARVEDNDPAGAKGAESPVATVRIISQQQLAELELSRRGMEALLSKQRAAQRRMENLRKQLADAKQKLDEAMKAKQEADASAQMGDPDAAEKQAAAEKAMQDAAEQLASAQKATAETAEAMRQSAAVELPVDLDKDLNEQLSQMAEKMEQMADRMQELQEKVAAGEQLSTDEQKELDELMQQFDQMQKQHEESAMNPTERMSKILPLTADQQRFSQLARRQRSLSDRLDALKSADSSDAATRRRADDLRREEQQLQVALSQLLEDIEAHANQLPDDPELDNLRQTAKEFVENVRASQADPAMTQTQQDLLADQTNTACQQAGKAADILESFLSECNSMGNQACQNCNASFSPSAGGPKPGNSISQLLQQMGLGEGQTGMRPGMGQRPGQQGSGPMGEGGYSMPQNTMENIGVYGGLPTQEPPPRQGNGDDSEGGFATYEQGGRSEGSRGGSSDTEDASARGDAGAVVPSVYQKQVSDYFRQLAEELGDL